MEPNKNKKTIKNTKEQNYSSLKRSSMALDKAEEFSALKSYKFMTESISSAQDMRKEMKNLKNKGKNNK